LFEQAVEDTKATRTKEVERIASSTHRDPPTEYHTSLKLMIGTYATLLYVLFGPKCNLFSQVYKIYMVLNQDGVFANRAAFDALKCKQIAWAIFEESQSFFWKKISPMDLAAGTAVEGVKSMLEDVIPDVPFARNVVRLTFPLAWQDKSNVYAPPAGHQCNICSSHFKDPCLSYRRIQVCLELILEYLHRHRQQERDQRWQQN
jgi:hypothetical protein